ncbi:MAG: hypothetical protein ABFD18_02695 [Syntrophomonas sp.]
MKKKVLLGLGLIILVVVVWMIFDYYHYFPPGIGKEEIKRQAEAILKKEAPGLIRNNMDPNTRKEFRSLDILDIEELKGKTYLVFKLNYDWVGPAEAMPYGFNSGGYILGLRNVEQKLGGISLQGGMEFESSYQGAGPVDCGQDADGVFYGFCKDPRVSRAALETKAGKSLPLQLKQRIILAQLPAKNMEVYPHFYAKDGSEIELAYGIKIAFLSKDEKSYQQYTNTPMEWWALKAKDSLYLRPDDVDAIWVFPDQQQEALQGEVASKLRSLAAEGIPVLFIGLKDSKVMAPVFKIKNQPGQTPADDIEALYVGKDANGSLQIGAIGLEDNEAFPIMQKTIYLRYQLQDYMTAKNNKGKSLDKTKQAPVSKTVTAPAAKAEQSGGTVRVNVPATVKGVTK